MQPTPLTVSELSAQVRSCLENAFPLLWVSGEISNLTRAASGHVYFSIKDETAQIRCVMFRQRASLIGWQLANGQQVEINAHVGFYEPRGDFQLTVEGMRRAGLGRLYEMFSRLRERLTAEGLFATEGKREVPAYPNCIGVISSPRAAALQDVLVTLRRRAPQLQVVIYPTAVQGSEAVPGITAALAAAHQNSRCDVLLMVRGGGSIEDLWAFNEERVIRAIASSHIPLVTGIGHETDLTLSDLAADQRGTTPTAAAELVTTHWFAARNKLHHLEVSLGRAMTHPLNQFRQRLDLATAQLIHPRERITNSQARLRHAQNLLDNSINATVQSLRHRLTQANLRLRAQRTSTETFTARLDQLRRRLDGAMTVMITRQEHRLNQLSQGLHLLSPDHTLERGYAIVRTDSGKVALAPADLPTGDCFTIQLARGKIRARSDTIAVDRKPD